MSTNIEALKWAIELAGPSQTKFARRLSEQSGVPVSQQTSHWVQAARVPLHWLIHIEQLTGVPCHELDPFHYPRKTPTYGPLLTGRPSKKEAS